MYKNNVDVFIIKQNSITNETVVKESVHHIRQSLDETNQYVSCTNSWHTCCRPNTLYHKCCYSSLGSVLINWISHNLVHILHHKTLSLVCGCAFVCKTLKSSAIKALLCAAHKIKRVHSCLYTNTNNVP